MSLRLSSTVVALVMWLAAAFASEIQAQELSSYTIQSNRIFVAGISSGGAMAVQMGVAYSSTFKGAAIYAGLPYYCAQGKLNNVATCSYATPPIDVISLENFTKSFARQGLIDPVKNLRGQPVYLWSGLLDTVVNQAAMNALELYYRDFGANVFRYDRDFAAGHGWESPYGPIQCGLAWSPFVNLCYDFNAIPPPLEWFPEVYDSEQVWLSQWFGPLRPKNDGRLDGSLLRFNQNEFASGNRAAEISMADTGYVFVPKSCANRATCGLILALHGCYQHYGAIGLAFINYAGINQWADSNNVIVLYPQTIASSDNLWTGCWDWWGYLNDPNYAQKTGPQMQALYRMVLRASGQP